jgi:predicted short-subunit dehydrogenase-like oxidoreductase (DUF2520 family)
MNIPTLPKIAIIGSGRVAKSLGLFFLSKGIQITGIYGRNKSTAERCAELLECKLINDPNLLEADLIVVSVSDDQTAELIDQLSLDKHIVYTAGSIELDEINHPNTGVFYPLQNFNGDESDTLFSFPILIESKTSRVSKLIDALCAHCQIENEICDSKKRKNYHLVAVFINNFITHIAHLSETESKSRQLNWDLLKPLIEKTLNIILT